MSNEYSRWRAIGQAALFLTITGLFLYTMAPFLIALVISAVIAILCQPGFSRLNRWLPPSLSAVAMTAAVTLGILAPLTFVCINMAYRLISILRGVKLPTLEELSHLSEHPLVIRYVHRIPEWIPIDKAWLQEQSLTIGQKAVEAISGALTSFLGQVPGVLLGFCVVIISVYFFILDGERLVRFLGSISPLPPEKSRELFFAFTNTCRGVVLGMFASAAAQGFLIGVVFAITGIPNPMLWGSIGVIMGMVPVIGVMPITVGGVIYLAVSSSIVWAVVGTLGAILIGFSDNIVRPWVLKGHGEMHPLLGLVSAFGAVSVLGPTGIILGPIIAALFVAFLEILSHDMKKNGGQSTLIATP
ncbi:AI-2E family transporter [bacterium]|nr:AI-2E family transporter [bacterium]